MHDWDDEGPIRGRTVLVGVLLAGLAALGWFVGRPALTGGDDSNAAAQQALTFDTAVASSAATTEPATTEPATTEPATTEPATTEPATTEPATTEPATTEPATTSSTSTTTSTSVPPTTVGSPYDTMPDGSPLPALAILDDDRITLSGAVPSVQSAEMLTAVALQNSQFPGLPVDNRLTVNPNVPVGVGVRVLELNSVRFGEGSAEIAPDHAAQLDRVAALMNAFPNITVVVVGHADQRGDEATNLVIAQRRADAVVAHLSSRGIAGSRLSARSAGEADLLTIDDDEASLALNRRTEFIVYGLLVPPPSSGPTSTTS